MSIVECKNILKKKATRSMKNKYPTDAADAMFRVFVLELLEKIAKRKKRKASAYSLFVGEQIKKGLTLADAAEGWRQRKK